MYTEPSPFGEWVDWDLGRGSSAGSSRFPSGGMGTYTSYPYARSLWVLSTYISNVLVVGWWEKETAALMGAASALLVQQRTAAKPPVSAIMLVVTILSR